MALDEARCGDHIILGVDNSTALWAVDHWFTNLDEGLALDLILLRARAELAGCYVSAVHTPGRIIAADDPSRDKALDRELCEKTREHLVHEVESRLTPFASKRERI